MSRARAHAACVALGITPALLRARALPYHAEARRLQPVGLGTDGRDKMLAPAAATAWLALCNAAQRDGIALRLISGFRSIDFQAALIAAKLARGAVLNEVLRINATPGYSEHHSGRAVDIGAENCAALDAAFEHTPAFEWLCRHAAAFGFSLSYPRGNPEGFLYEPWHWCWHAMRGKALFS
jgi:D-alanyl-D-alanine carboxypeptidase